MNAPHNNNLIKPYRRYVPIHFVMMALVTVALLFYLLFFMVVQVVSVHNMLEDTHSFRTRFVKSNDVQEYLTGMTNPSFAEQYVEEHKSQLETQMDRYALYGQVGLFISLLIHFPIMFLWLRQIIREVREYGNGVRSKIIFEPSKCLFIKEMVQELCLKMGIDGRRVVVMSTLNPLSPFVTRWRGKYHVVISTNSIELAVKDPHLLRATLAHELGHVLQHDANLGRWSRIILVATERFILLDFFITTLTLSVMVGLFSPSDSGWVQQMGYVLYFLFWSSSAFIMISLYAAVSTLIPFFVARFVCVRLIRGSEYLADRAAVVFGDQGDHLFRALTHFAPKKKRRVYLRTHPEIGKRLERVDKLQRRLSTGEKNRNEDFVRLRLE